MSLEDQKDNSSIPRNKSSIHLKVKNDIEGVKNPAYNDETDEVKPTEIDHLNHVEIVDNLHKRVSQLEKDVETVDNLHKRVLQLERDKVKVSFCLTRNSNDIAASAQNQSRTNPAIADDLKEHEEHTVKTEEVALEKVSWGSTLWILASGILLPTIDSYSDVVLVARLFLGNYYQDLNCEKKNYIVPPHPKFGAVSLLPILATWFFVARHWFIIESTLSRKVKTLPLVILQIYPQWRASRLLFATARRVNAFYLERRKCDAEWQRRKEEYEYGISHLEPFGEAVPQWHILLLIGILSKKYDYCKAPVLFSIWRIDYLFIVTFCCSFVTAALGVTKFVKSGPAGIVRDDRCLKGFGTITFLLLFTNIAATLTARGLVIAVYVDLVRHAAPTYLLLISLCFIPQFIHAYGTLVLALGMKKATRLFISDPAFVLTPVFSFWTYGPMTSGGCYAYGITEPKISFSFRLTWVNSFVTIVGTFGVVLLHDFSIRMGISHLFTAESWLGNQSFLLFFFTYPLPLFALAIICLILVQHLEKCSSCYCECFTDNCLPLTDKTETFVTTRVELNLREYKIDSHVRKYSRRGSMVEEKIKISNVRKYQRRKSLVIV